MAQNVPPALEQEIQKFDTMRKNYETLSAIVQNSQVELSEINATLEELKKQPDDVVTYKTVGQVMFKVEKSALVEDLDDKRQRIELRLASNKKQLETLTGKLQELQNKIQIELSKQNLRLQ